MPRLAVFISSHGLGHSARVCALLERLWERLPELEVELVTAAPAWFFRQSLGSDRRSLTHRELVVDFGMVQANSLDEDVGATARQLAERIPFPDQEIERLARLLRPSDGPSADLVLCDIAPLGLVAAHRAGVPAVLLENFTWDWIYRGYTEAEPALGPIAEHLADAFALADLHIQTEPICRPRDGAVQVGPMSRRPRLERAEVRAQLGIPLDAPMVLVTMGGIPWDYGELATIEDGPWLVVPGSHAARKAGRVVLLPHRSDVYHPDLVHAADGVLGKLGYSTVAEVAHAGVPFGYVTRERFPESARLEAWVREHLPCRRLAPEVFAAGGWRDAASELLDLERHTPAVPDDGAVHAADAVAARLTP